MSAPGEAFQYAVLRVVPSVPRGERVNVGVVLYCRRLDYLALRVEVDEARVRALDPEIDLDAVRAHLDGLVAIAAGEDGAGPVAAMPPSDRFGYLTAPSSTIVQPSEVHTGLSGTPAEVHERLMEELVRAQS